jgi:hypothetical protein
MRSMVEGASRKRHDRRGNGVDIPQDFGRRDPQHPVTVLTQKLIPNRIADGTIGPIVRLAVDFDDQCRIEIAKVDHIRANRMLTTKLETRLPRPQALP